PAAAHDGPYGLRLTDPPGVFSLLALSSMYRDDLPAQVERGDVMSVWIRSEGLLTGPASFAFGASESGYLAMVMDAGTGQGRIQRDLHLLDGPDTLGSAPQAWLPDHWYRFEVTWARNGDIIGRVFDSDGTTLLNTVTTHDDMFLSGGLGFSVYPFSGVAQFDTVRVDRGIDSDFYRITLAAFEELNLATSTPDDPTGNTLDPMIRLYDANGVLLALDDNSADGRNARLRYLAQQGGTFFIEVLPAAGSGDTTLGAYFLDFVVAQGGSPG